MCICGDYATGIERKIGETGLHYSNGAGAEANVYPSKKPQIRPKKPGLKYPIRYKNVTLSQKVTETVTCCSWSENSKNAIICFEPTVMLVEQAEHYIFLAGDCGAAITGDFTTQLSALDFISC
jgi:hypothetical protein